jgi:hypothetical protein
MLNCDNCGKSMTSETGQTIVALSMRLSQDDLKDRFFIDKQLGVYAGKSSFNFCYECCIDAIMRRT